MSLIVKSGSSTVLTDTFDVTSTSAGCTTNASVTTCTEIFTLAPGSYTASVATYDAANGSGNVLSEEQLAGFTVASGVANAIPLTLYGVPKTIAVSGNAPTVWGSQSGGFTVFGSVAQSLAITAKDADGNTIVGPGLPTWNVTASSGSGFSIVQPASGANTFSLTPSGNVSETFTVTASYSDASVCAQSDADCATTFSASREQTLVYCADNGEVYALAPPYTGTPSVIDTNMCDADYEKIAVDSYGIVFVARNAAIDIIEPPYTSVTTLTTLTGSSYQGLAVDAAGDALLCGGGVPAADAYLFEISPPYTSVSKPGVQCSTSNPQMVFTGSGVAIDYTSYVEEIASPYTSVEATATPGPSGGQQAIAADATGDVAIVSNKLVEFPAGRFTSPVDVGAASSYSDVAFDHLGNLYASTDADVVEYEPPFSSSSSSVATMNFGGTNAERLVFDSGEDLFASGGTGIYELAPPYTGTPAQLVTTNAVYALGITP